jgi:hypothetical protein
MQGGWQLISESMVAAQRRFPPKTMDPMETDLLFFFD